MNWLRRLLGGTERAPALPEAAPDAALPLETPVFAEDADNAIHHLLDDAGLPWRTPRGALIADHGLRRHPAYDWDVIELPSRKPLVEGLLWPISAQGVRDLSPLMPATSLSGVTWFADDAEVNIRRTAQQLEAALGPERIAKRYNTLHCEWRAGAATLSLTVWPPEAQGDWANSNPSHEREPRLATGCHVAIHTGLLPMLTERERNWLANWEPILSSPAPSGWFGAAVPETHLPFVRPSSAGLDVPPGTIGRAAASEALILHRHWLYLFPAADILRFEVTRMTPAKGPGGSYLTIVCAVPGADDAQVTAAEASGPDDLNDLGRQLSKTFGKPVTLGPYWPDC